jgi:geranylgeranyl transferase type-2 subunit alpha
MGRSEFKLIRDAMYTDPHDQSIWIYHRWLIGNSEFSFYAHLPHPNPDTSTESSQEVLEREIEAIHELLVEQPDSKCRRPST